MSGLDLYPLLSRVAPRLGARYESWRRKKIIRFLTHVRPESLERAGERLALKAFRHTALHVRRYRRLLKEKNIDPSSIRTIKDFKRLPIVDKSIFYQNPIGDLTIDGTLRGIKTILTSSGFSGKFSFGVNLPKNLENTARTIDLVLDYTLGIGRKRTLAINCLPMGVKVHTNIMVLAEVSVRDDMALALVEKFSPYFEQIIIVGEAFFLKHLIEEGIKKGIDWRRVPVSIVTGEDSFPESYRDYMGGLLGISHDTLPIPRLIGSSMGIAEIDLNLFHETPDTIRIRRFAEKNEEFRRALFGRDIPYTPMVFHYYPHRTYLEVNESHEITTTTTTYTPADIPLIRYNTKDRGATLSYSRLRDILKSFGRKDLLPALKLPLVLVESRHSDSEEKIRIAEALRSALFRDSEIARRVTGFFKVHGEAAPYQISLQLERDQDVSKDGSFVLSRLRVEDTKINPIAYLDFKDALILNYEKKFHH